ncbi:S-adenosylmethionine:tRNA ribosyltransferase-isomerase [Bacillus sp. REN3]|uniref:S-adenosylmethionine:tRNA ribosyltransferase-isomerase n=1 Tax=Bacillus sp. REN3 TaxID=2802440 RepID=UPI001FF048C3|nr:S-adenosylmethionine:tRNA ribosyltransferase-isomerase [Bacillus sp. REN3]
MQMNIKEPMHDFVLPSELNATCPPERRGVRRDHVRMLVLNRISGKIKHAFFNQVDEYLKPGDVLVLNSSRTIPAILKADWKRQHHSLGKEIEIRLASRNDDSTWEALIVAEDVRIGDDFLFDKTLTAKVIANKVHSPLKKIRFSLGGTALLEEIYSVGEPVRYEYIDHPWELDYYQTVFASSPGSVEMPSAGRAFSWELLFKLRKKGIKLAFIQLHSGLSYLLDDDYDHSPENHHEEYVISKEAFETILQAKRTENKVIAAGTTVVRAIEAAATKGCLSGWTNLYVTADYDLKLTDGIITGFHEPKASHLDMLTAFIDKEKMFAAYESAMSEKYLWHEFGDINLII